MSDPESVGDSTNESLSSSDSDSLSISTLDINSTSDLDSEPDEEEEKFVPPKWAKSRKKKYASIARLKKFRGKDNPLEGIAFPDIKKVDTRFMMGRDRMVAKIKAGLDAARHNERVSAKIRARRVLNKTPVSPEYDKLNLDEFQYTREESLKAAWKDLYSSCPIDTRNFVECTDAIGLEHCERSLMSLSQCAAIEHCFHGWVSMVQNCSDGWAQNYTFPCQDSKAAVHACFSEYGFPEALQRAVLHLVQTDPTGARRSAARKMRMRPSDIDSEGVWEGFPEEASDLLKEGEQIQKNKKQNDGDSLD